jgi:hypothetical protein
MAKYLLIFHYGLTCEDGDTTSGSDEVIVDCKSNELEERIAEEKQDLNDTFRRHMGTGDHVVVLLKQVLPL